ncbi:hypothetical protein ACQJBY_057924 [Aegilops geniculata]
MYSILLSLKDAPAPNTSRRRDPSRSAADEDRVEPPPALARLPTMCASGRRSRSRSGALSGGGGWGRARPLPRAPVAPSSISIWIEGTRSSCLPETPTVGLLLAPPLHPAPPRPLETGKPWPKLDLEVPAAVSCSFCPAASPPELATAPTSVPAPPPALVASTSAPGNPRSPTRWSTTADDGCLVVCDGCSSHAQARVGAASSSSCPPAASLPVPHCGLPLSQVHLVLYSSHNNCET